MKHIKLFEELNITNDDFPENGHELNSREKQILEDLVGEDFIKHFEIRKEDNYYYTSSYDDDNYSGFDNNYNQFDGFNELKDYILCRYYISNKNKKINNLLKLLQITDLDPSFDNNRLIRWASFNGHTEVVKLLLKDPRVDPSDDDNYSIKWASYRGQSEVVKILLQDPRVDPSADNNFAIKWASRRGYTEVVKLLLDDPRVDPSIQNNYAIRWATHADNKKVVKLLIQDPRVREKLTKKEIKEYESY